MFAIFLSFMLLFGATEGKGRDISGSGIIDTCWINLDLEEHRNMEVIAAGKLIEYVPPHDNSKLGNEKIWNYELQMQDGYTVPLKISDASLELEGFKDKDVFIKAFMKYGIIFGDTNTANMQGYRIDPIAVYVNERGYGMPYYERKIRINLREFYDDGYRKMPDAQGSPANYEFCIPASDSLWAEASKMDSTLGLYKDSKGRSGCTDKEWLCIGSTRQKGFKEVLRKLSALKYIRKITETFWE